MTSPLFFIPVENQVRELDAKLLLASFAAERGYSSVLGWKGAIDSRLQDYPRGVYIAKSITSRAVKVFRITRSLGHRIVAWDEEAVAHFPPNIYYARRCDAKALSLAHQLLAWGEDNRQLFEAAPDYSGTRIDVVGNPRVDLLRREFRGYFDADVAELRERFGDFILVNTNFGSINGYYPELNVAYEKDGELALGRGAMGLPHELAFDLYAYRRRVLERFREMIPKLAAAYPERALVLRPHPAENREFWQGALKGCANVEVVAEGNVVPWLLACAVLVHNGCTTAIESYILERPALAYQPYKSEALDIDLPNVMSQSSETPDDLIAQVKAVLASGGHCTCTPERSATLGRFVTALDGELATSRILDSIESDLTFDDVSVADKAFAHTFARARRFLKDMKMRKNTGRYSQGFVNQRFPDVTESDLERRARRLSELGGLKSEIRVRGLRPDIFELSPA